MFGRHCKEGRGLLLVLFVCLFVCFVLLDDFEIMGACSQSVE